MLDPQVPKRPAIFTAVPQFPVTLRRPSSFSKLPQVDLRPTIEALGLDVRSQGTRGTCSVFTLTFLLEYAYGTRLNTGSNDLSEEYLNYVTNLVSGNTSDGDYFSNIDQGFQAWGIVPEAIEPYQPTAVTTIAQSVLDSGRLWTRFTSDFIKTWDNTKGASQSQLDRAIAYLDQNLAVGFGGWWPNKSTWSTTLVGGIDVIRTPPLSQKSTSVFDGHSVPLVGYRRDSAFAGGGYFVFRNSAGATWGDQGYGYMPFDYVLNYANDLVAYTTRSIGTVHIGTQAVVAHVDRLDVFVTDSKGVVSGAGWQQDLLSGNWRDWWSILPDPTVGHSVSGAPVGAVARDIDKLDLFVAGADGKTYSAAWDRNVTNGQWRGWWNILLGAIPAGGTISAVSRGPNNLDIFLVSNDGGVYTAAWDANVANGQWRGWSRILNLAAKPGAPVAVVSRDPNKLDIFVAGADGKTYSAAWDGGAANPQWQGWWNILTGAIPAGGTISAVSRDPKKLDIFLVSNDGGVYTAAWDANVAGGWHGWWRILTGVAAPGSAVAAVSRDPNKLDLFVIGTDGGVYSAAWDANVAGGWRGWWQILTGYARPGSGVTAVSRDANKLDVFMVGTDGAVWTAAWDANVAGGQWRGWWRIEP